mgnify:CR=1 FL=1
MSKANQSTDAANMGKSGGVNFQGGPVRGVDVAKADNGVGKVPAKGTSNGGK